MRLLPIFGQNLKVFAGAFNWLVALLNQLRDTSNYYASSGFQIARKCSFACDYLVERNRNIHISWLTRFLLRLFVKHSQCINTTEGDC